MSDLTASQTQPTAERACPFRQTRRTVWGPSTGWLHPAPVGSPAHAARCRRPGAPGGPERPPSPARPAWPAVPPAVAPPDGGERGRAPQAAQTAPGSRLPGPLGSHRRSSPRGRSAPGDRSGRRHRPTQVSTPPTPPTPALSRADVHAWCVGGSVGRMSGPRPRLGPPTDTSQPMGEWGACLGRNLRPAGLVLGLSANAEGIVRAASSALRIGGRRDPQQTTIRST